MSKRLWSSVLLIGLFLPGYSFSGTEELSAAPALHMDRAFTGPCIFGVSSSPRAAFLAAIIPSLLNISLDRLGKALTNAGEAKTITRTATANIEISSKTDERPACLLFVSGSFETGPDAKTIASALPLGSAVSDSDSSLILMALNGRGIFLAGPPDALVEARLTWSSDGSAVAFEINAIEYGKHFGGGLFDSFKSERDLVISISIAEPGSEGNKGTGSLSSVTFQKLKPAQLTYRFAASKGRSLGLPSTAWIPIKLPATQAPRTVLISFAEANDGNQFLSFLGDVLSGSKAQIQTEAENILIPAKRDAAEKAQRDAAVAVDLSAKQLLSTAKNDEVVARNAMDDLNQVSQTYNAEKNAGHKPDAKVVRTSAGNTIAKILVANHSARSAGIPEPFGDNDIQTANSFVRLAD